MSRRLPVRVPATLLACVVLATAACESPYRDRGILDKDVAARLNRIDGADLGLLLSGWGPCVQ